MRRMRRSSPVSSSVLDRTKGHSTMPTEDSDALARVAAARREALEARLTHPLSEEQRAQVLKRIERTLKLAAAMRELPLTNADEPEIVFAPYRGER
jgi:hypothetical protein